MLEWLKNLLIITRLRRPRRGADRVGRERARRDAGVDG
jgi:hypothetical protein